MDEPLGALIARLRAEYLAEVPARLDELTRHARALAREEPRARDDLTRLFHRLAGSAGAYGFGTVTALCRGAEQELKQTQASRPAAERMFRVISEIQAAFDAGPTTEAIAGNEDDT